MGMTKIELDESTTRADVPSRDDTRDDHTHEVRPDLAYQRVGIVNLMHFGLPQEGGSGTWVLIDAGLPGTAGVIKRGAHARFGDHARPACIILTHAHADHAGALEALAKDWEVPIYAHELELPYLNGTAAYPPPDPGVGGGLMPALSLLFPRGPFNVSQWLRPLPSDQSVPGMTGWKWLHTPGHTPGHVSLWRENDRSLIVGDAFITTKQESVYAALAQTAEMHGPPSYYTQNWEQAETSVQKLAALNPDLAITGHGRAMQGEPMRSALNKLAKDFRKIAIPEHSKYAEHPTSAKTGSAYIVRKEK
jgi:glyoxylase-like metal-dependent hydrolase (beta-lactamase superfamily II)